MALESISVVVPIYNVDEYLDRCIKSVLGQTYQNLELILVDDGSPDRCPEICDQWAQKDSRIRVIHKPNGGVSSARNAGMKAANGVWLAFLDPDDFLPKDALEHLVTLQQRHQADFVCGSIHGIKTRNRSEDTVYKDAVLSRETFANNMSFLINNIHPSCCAKLYSTGIIKEYALEFPQDTPWGEDAIFYCHYVARVSTIVTTGQFVYHYDMRREGSAVKRYHENLNQFARKQLETQKELISSIGEPQPELMNAQERKLFTSCLLNYALYETDRKKRAEKIQEAAMLFPEAANHELYGEAIRKQDWHLAARLWQRHHFKWYLKVTLQRFCAKLR